MRNILVIGANAAGLSFAAKYRRNNDIDKITVIEKGEVISFGACGLPYYIGNQFDDYNEMVVKTDFPGIEIILNHEVKNIDTTNKIIDDVYPYDILVIASGASPINIFNHNKLTTLEDGLKLKDNIGKKVAIIGGGFIGLEILDNLKQNHDITLFEKENQVLNNLLDPELASILPLDNIKLNQEFIDDNYDTVFECIGFRPNTKFINCDKLENGAIITNHNCQSSIKDIYAIGDCATVINIVSGKSMYLPLATSANKCGRFLADHLAGIKTTYKGMLGSWCIETQGYEIASTGINEATAIANNIKYKAKIIKDKNHTSYVKNQSDITAKIIYDPITLKILGCQMIGINGVVSRVNTIALAIDSGVTTSELGYTDFAYAPPFNRTWDFLNVIGNVCK